MLAKGNGVVTAHVDLERGGFECQDNEQPNDNEEQETMTQMLEATVCEP